MLPLLLLQYLMHTLPMTVIQRKSLPLTERDLADLAKLRTSADHRAALAALVALDLPEGTSESRILHAVLEAGLKAVRERMQEDGYAALAADPEHIAYHAARRSHRRRPAWADEE